MYFNKYYSYKTKEYIYKTVLSEHELFLFKKIVKGYMPEVDYNKILIKRLILANEYKYIDSPNSIGSDVLKEIEQSDKKYYTVELTKDEQEELYEQFFKTVLLMEEYRKSTDDIVEKMFENNQAIADDNAKELNDRLKFLGIKSRYE